jgi:hypothetical protein
MCGDSCEARRIFTAAPTGGQNVMCITLRLGVAAAQERLSLEIG